MVVVAAAVDTAAGAAPGLVAAAGDAGVVGMGRAETGSGVDMLAALHAAAAAVAAVVAAANPGEERDWRLGGVLGRKEEALESSPPGPCQQPPPRPRRLCRP